MPKLKVPRVIPHRLWKRSVNLLAVPLLLAASGTLLAGQAQQRSMVLVNLNEHRFVPDQHLLFFSGATPRRVRRHVTPQKLVTDSQGRTSFTWSPRMHYFQVLIDAPSACADRTYANFVYHSSVLFDQGIVVNNSCPPALERLMPDDPIPPIVR